MKIIYLHQYFNTPNMSGGTRSYEMGRRLVQAGHEVHIVTSTHTQASVGKDGWYTTQEGGMNVHWYPLAYSNKLSYHKRIGVFIRFALASRMKARALGGDLIFATSTPLTIAIPGAYAACKNRIPMVFEVRDLWPALPIALGAVKNPLLRFAAHCLEKYAYRHSKHIIALSPGMKDGIVATGYPAKNVTVVPNSSDIELFDVAPSRGKKIRADHPWLGDRPMLLYAGAIGMIHGVGYLVKLAAAAASRDPRICFVVAGTGSEEDKVRQMACELGVFEKNFFMIGARPKREIPDWHSACDICTSIVIDKQELWAASPNKVFDAMAAGRPIVINYLGWQRDFLEPEGAALVLPPQDMETAAELLVKHLHDAAWLSRAREASHRLARTRFSRDLLFDTLHGVLKSAVEK